jgi:L-serine dehydratase
VGLAYRGLTPGAIGILCKDNASISGAEVGCQSGLGWLAPWQPEGWRLHSVGNNLHVEYAAEIGMEHNLGMTRDPIGDWFRFLALSAMPWE